MRAPVATPTTLPTLPLPCATFSLMCVPLPQLVLGCAPGVVAFNLAWPSDHVAPFKGDCLHVCTTCVSNAMDRRRWWKSL